MASSFRGSDSLSVRRAADETNIRTNADRDADEEGREGVWSFAFLNCGSLSLLSPLLYLIPLFAVVIVAVGGGRAKWLLALDGITMMKGSFVRSFVPSFGGNQRPAAVRAGGTAAVAARESDYSASWETVVSSAGRTDGPLSPTRNRAPSLS